MNDSIEDVTGLDELVGDKKDALALSIDKIFSTGGPLSEHLPGYESRPSQVELANAVYDMMQGGHNLCGEGACGVGKSLAYLIPAVKTGKRVLVVTANIALQEQLYKKDLPFVVSVFGDFNYVLLKGRNNYLCYDKMEDVRADYDGQRSLFGGNYSCDISQAKLILEWFNRTISGDKSELEFEPQVKLWSKCSSGKDDCLGKICKHKDECFVNRSRNGLKEASVIVTNYHILFSYVKVLNEQGFSILPEFDFLVCDEGHKIADIAKSFFGWEVGKVSIAGIINSFAKSEPAFHEVMEQIRELSDEDREAANFAGITFEELDVMDINWLTKFENASRDFWHDCGRFHDSGNLYKGIGCVRFRESSSGLYIDELCNCLRLVSAAFGLIADRFMDTPKTKEKMKKQSERAGALCKKIEELDEFPDPLGVYFTEMRGGKNASMKIVKRKVDVSSDLWNGLFKACSTFVTSATLAVKGKCDFIRKQIGLKESREIVVDSPFDFEKQALMILSRNAPDPTQPKEFPDKVARVVEYVIGKTKGRALCLFTSYRVMKVVQEYLTSERSHGCNILCQGDMPRMKLINRFKNDMHSVLLGVESFWAGIDVPGPSLSCLIIDKIPFKSPGDPVWDAMCERAGDKWFFTLGIPAATLQLKQGVGRLIRSKSDRGVVVVLDRRMLTKPYGGTLIDSLPEMGASTTLQGDVLPDFINGNLNNSLHTGEKEIK